MDKVYAYACEELYKEDARKARKAARRKRFWANLGQSLIQTVVQTSYAMSRGYYGGLGYLSGSSNLPLNNFNNSIAMSGFAGIDKMIVPTLNLNNLNSGLNAAIITANSVDRLNQSWGQFQTSMVNMRPYTFEEIEQMSLNSFNAQFGLNFTQDQYNQAISNWSSQGATDTALGGVSLPERPDDSDGDERWDNYYRTAYTRWEQHAESTYDSLTKFGIKHTGADGQPKGNVGARGNAGGSAVQLKMNLFDIQKQMRNIRREAKIKGIDIAQSRWEVAVVDM